MTPCKFPKCGKRVVARGLCDGHRKQASRGYSLTPLKSGDLTAELGSVRVPHWLPEMISQAAELDGVTVAQWIRDALTSALPLDRLAE